MEKNILLIIGLVWPEPKSSAAGTRMLQLINIFQEQGFEITFVSAAQKSDFSFNLESLGIKTHSIVLNCSSFDIFIKELNPKIVLFDRYIIEEQYAARVVEQCPNAMRILDTEDLHCLRAARENAVKKNIIFQFEDLVNEPIALREIASIYRCDVSLIISEVECHILTTIFNISSHLIYYLPLFYVNELCLPKFEDRNDFVFIGNFLHKPNWDAVTVLKTRIWPLIHSQLPDAKMHIYGAYPSQKVFELHKPKEQFYVHGRAEHANEVIKKAKVMLAPLRYGGGLKGKLLEAMTQGTPSVTTAVGAEGIYTNSWNGYVCDDEMVYANNAVKLYKDREYWLLCQEIGFSIINNKFIKENFTKHFFETIKRIYESLDNYRKNNFVGRILFYHNHMSIKYMSKWIEEKNKKD